MSRIFISLLLATAWIDGHAQSSLPPCPDEPFDQWSNCSATWTFPDDSKYSGGWKDDKQYGRGSLISPQGYTIVEGIWRDDRTVMTSGVRWYLAGYAAESRFFVSMESIRQDGAFRRAWVMSAYYEPITENRWLSARALHKFDCLDQRQLTMTITLFSGSFGSGESSGTVDNDQWKYVPPGTGFFDVMKYVCDYKLTPKK